jgi:regulator of sirC expression with transglutaminase-like and TPR domain
MACCERRQGLRLFQWTKKLKILYLQGPMLEQARGSNLELTLGEISNLLSKVKSPVMDDWDPLRLGLLLSKLEYEDLDVEAQLKAFKDQVAPLLKDCPQTKQIWEKVAFVSKIFNEDLGFKGDTANYYNIKNSFLNDVLLRRKGIPITLSLVYMGLCREVGLKALGIAFPGHFLVRIVDTEEDVAAIDWRQQRFIDTFDGGRILSVDECEARLEEWTRGVLVFGPEALRVAHPSDIAARMLRNLKAIFAEKEDLARLYWVLTALIELSPAERIESLKERGLLMGRMGRYSQATCDLRNYIRSCEDPQRVAHAERLLNFFQGQREFTN